MGVGAVLLNRHRANQESVTITTVGTSGAAGTGVTFSTPLSNAHASGVTVRVQPRSHS
jgi:hypothetical protein